MINSIITIDNVKGYIGEIGLVKSENEEVPNYIPETVFYLLAMKGKLVISKGIEYIFKLLRKLGYEEYV